jgi:hypothetical protein
LKNCTSEESWPTPLRSRKQRTFWASTRQRFGAGEKPTEFDLAFHEHMPCIMQDHARSCLSGFKADSLRKPYNLLKTHVLHYGTTVAIYMGACCN